MTIEFRCQSCDQLLRVPAGTEGKQAKCPQCAALMDIPAESTYAPPPRERELVSENPYRTPQAVPDLPVAAPAGFRPTPIYATEVLDQTWTIFKAYPLVCMGGVLVPGLCAQIVQGLAGGVFSAVANQGDLAVLVASLGVALVAAASNVFFTMGALQFFIRVARTGEGRFGDLFSAGPILLPATGVLVLLTLGIAVGLVLLIVPGVLFGLMFGLAPYLFLDHRCGVIDSFHRSAEAMRGNKLAVFSFWALASLGAIAVTVLSCGLGALVAGPFMYLAGAVIYLLATGQPTAAARLNPQPGNFTGFAPGQFPATGFPPPGSGPANG